MHAFILCCSFVCFGGDKLPGVAAASNHVMNLNHKHLLLSIQITPHSDPYNLNMFFLWITLCFITIMWFLCYLLNHGSLSVYDIEREIKGTLITSM